MTPGKRWVLAVSGGPDSMALLDVLHRLQEALDMQLLVVYVHHGLRPEADAEQRFVEGQAARRGLECVCCRRDVPQLRLSGESVEACARRVRYAALEAVRQEKQAEGILTAHHQDDAAETVLLHLLRGSGLTGLSGIHPVRGRIYRPLLGISRKEIEDYLKTEGIPYCVDATNADTAYTRNRIRAVLLPLLQEQFNPQVVAALNRLAQLAAEDDAALAEWTERAWETVRKEESAQKIVFSAAALKGLPLALQRRLVRKAFARIKGAEGFTAQDVQDVLDLAEKPGSSARISLKKQLGCRKVYDELIITAEPLPKENPPFCVPVTLPGEIVLAETGRRYRFFLEDTTRLSSELPGLYLDEEKLQAPLVLRSRLPGDRFYPAGAPGSKKLKDWMMDRKIPQAHRDKTALLVDAAGRICAVLPFAVSELCRVDAATRTVLRIEEVSVHSGQNEDE